MTKQQVENKAMVIHYMLATAEHNGKRTSYLEMVGLANRLHRLEATLSRLAEDQCCCESYDSAKQERLENLAEKLIRENIGCECYTQRDPRGLIIRMYLTDENGNKWFNSCDGETSGLNW